MEGREKGGTPFKIQCANAAAAVTREMKSGEQGVITMRGRGGKNEWKVAGGPYSAFSRIRYIMEERVMDRVYSLMWTLFLLDNVWLIFLCMQMWESLRCRCRHTLTDADNESIPPLYAEWSS